MIPRLNIEFPLKRQWQYWCGEEYEPKEGEYLVNHARTGIVMALKASLPNGGRVGVVVYNCYTVANAVTQAGCTSVFIDVTEELKIDVESVPEDLDALVVTNLFGIRNDIEAIRARCPKAIIIVDNAHGYGLPEEGDFTVYSINQGKFPALGEGGILIVSGLGIRGLEFRGLEEMYTQLPAYGFVAQVKLFVQMLVKAIAYSRLCYWMVMKLKRVSGLAVSGVGEKIVMRKMAPGVRRLYCAALPEIPKMIDLRRQNAAKIDGAFYGDNAFMAVVRCEDPEELKRDFAQRGVETETHFKNAIVWAEQFGYKCGDCPKAEELTKHLLMIPTYTKI